MSTCRWIPLCDVLILVLEGGQKGLPSLFDCARRSGRGRVDALKSPALPRSQSHDTTDQRSPKEAHKFSCVFVVVFRARTPDLPNLYYLSIYTHEPRRPSRPLEAHPKESGINRPGFELGHAVCWKALVLCWQARWARRPAVFGRWAPIFLASFSAFRGGSRKPSRLTRPAAECPITISHRHHLPPRLRLPPRTRRCLDPFSSSFSKMAEVRRPFRSVCWFSLRLALVTTV